MILHANLSLLEGKAGGSCCLGGCQELNQGPTELKASVLRGCANCVFLSHSLWYRCNQTHTAQPKRCAGAAGHTSPSQNQCDCEDAVCTWTALCPCAAPSGHVSWAEGHPDSACLAHGLLWFFSCCCCVFFFFSFNVIVFPYNTFAISNLSAIQTMDPRSPKGQGSRAVVQAQCQSLSHPRTGHPGV